MFCPYVLDFQETTSWVRSDVAVPGYVLFWLVHRIDCLVFVSDVAQTLVMGLFAQTSDYDLTFHETVVRFGVAKGTGAICFFSAGDINLEQGLQGRGGVLCASVDHHVEESNLTVGNNFGVSRSWKNSDV